MTPPSGGVIAFWGHLSVVHRAARRRRASGFVIRYPLPGTGISDINVHEKMRKTRNECMPHKFATELTYEMIDR